jgi:hypothetical protein
MILGMRTNKCIQCGTDFAYEGIGAPRRLCSDFCRTKRRHANLKLRPLCVVEGCQNPRQYASGVCNACYVRQWRGGDLLQKPKPAYRSLSTHGYVRVSNSTHPLSSNSFVYEHRKVLYDAIGEGPHACHWCGTAVQWVKGRCVKGSLVPDHLDGDKTNNSLGNLVPACNRCNATRGLFMAWVRKHKDDPLLWQMYQDARPVSA